MTDQNSDALGEAVSGAFAMLVEDYQPTVDLVPAVLAQARRDIKRRRLTWGLGGGVFVATAVTAAVFSALALDHPAVNATVPLVDVSPTQQPSTLNLNLNLACVGKWLPWTSESDANLFGKGSDAQREVVCTKDIAALKTILPSATIAPYYENFSDGAKADFTPDEIAELGPGTPPNTHILKPWQYTVTLNGHSVYFFVTYSANRTDLCSGCNVDVSVPLPGPSGYVLVKETTGASSQQSVNEDLIETPRHTYLGVGVSELTGGPFEPPVDVTQLAHDSRFMTMLDADLTELYGH